MTPFEQWNQALQEAQSPRQVETIAAQCREGLAAGDKVGWSRVAKDALFDSNLRNAALMLEREEQLFQGEPDSAAALHHVATLFKAAVRRLDELES
jgi:hypothetical protein